MRPIMLWLRDGGPACAQRASQGRARAPTAGPAPLDLALAFHGGSAAEQRA
jgi:hypothetical protein